MLRFEAVGTPFDVEGVFCASAIAACTWSGSQLSGPGLEGQSTLALHAASVMRV